MAFNTQLALQYYSNLLITQYNSLPKATATIQTLANCSVCDNFYGTLQSAFTLNTAVGNQLTIIGKIVGVPRSIYGLNLVDTFFTFSNWAGQPASVGFNTWTTPTDTDKIAAWASNAVYIPTDFEMTALIKLKIIRNNAFTSLGQIVPLLYSYFGNSISLVDNFNTSITWNFASPYHNVGSVAQFLGNIVPKPMGCAINYVNV